MSSELKKASTGRKFIGSLMAFLVFGLLVLVWHWLTPREEGLDDKRAQARKDKLAALQKDNETKLTTYAWVNKDKGVVQIPIDQAMKLVAVELAGKPVKASAVKVENPYPYGLQNFSFVPAPAASGTTAPAPAASGTASPAPAASGSAAPAASGTAAPPSPESGTVAPSPAPAPSGTAPTTPAATPAP